MKVVVSLTDEKLLPCPFCGADCAELLPWGTRITCAECGAEVSSSRFEPDGENPVDDLIDRARGNVDLWNTRATSLPSTVKPGLVVRMEGPRGCGKTWLASVLREMLPGIAVVDGAESV